MFWGLANKIAAVGSVEGIPLFVFHGENDPTLHSMSMNSKITGFLELPRTHLLEELIDVLSKWASLGGLEPMYLTKVQLS